MSSRRFPRLKDGDTPEPFHFNIIYAELERQSRRTGQGQARLTDGDDPVLVVDRDTNLIRDAIVVTQAAAATIVSGKRRSAWGTMKLLVCTAINAATDPPTIDWEAETLPTGKSRPFFSNFLGGSSPAAGKLCLVRLTPLGWELAVNDCG
jgi:hypothetical protein